MVSPTSIPPENPSMPDPECSDLDLIDPLTCTNTKMMSDIFKSVGDHYRNDINAVWQRSQFFQLSNLGLLAFFYSNAFDRGNIASVIGISITGIVISLFWLLIAKVTIAWIDTWRNALVDVEKVMVYKGPYKLGENIDGKEFHEKYRPEFFAVVVAFIFLLGWLLILIGSFFHLWH
jgi:hypothetical protein